MTIASAAPPAPRIPGTVLLRHISWRAYRMLLDEVGDEPVHLTYDDGLLEIELPSERHEQLKKVTGRLIELALESAGVEFEPLGSTTWNREEKLKGIEADECFYVQSVDRIRGRRPVTLGVDPPPDLAVEVDVTASSIDKLGIYAALGIPEVWRVRDDGSVQFLSRDAGGVYVPVARSAAVPGVPPEVVEAHLRHLEPAGTWTYSEFVRRFTAWLRNPTALLAL